MRTLPFSVGRVRIMRSGGGVAPSFRLVILRLGLAWKPRLGLGSPGLWLHFPQAQAQAVEEGLAWLGFGLSRGLCKGLLPDAPNTRIITRCMSYNRV